LIETELADAYPHQWLQPEKGVTGMGLISRYPITPVPHTWAIGGWVGEPQLATVDFNGRSITILNFHAIPPGRFGDMAERAAFREQQVGAILAVAAAQDAPFVAMGDLNAADLNVAYSLMTAELNDAWREAGWGMGHTFPGLSYFPKPLGRLTKWLTRIDYIFYDDHWRASRAWLPDSGVGSDHRLVAAELVLR
jgi:endonuclease/exonuclease/phosphatase (EEP) superfamily protein YafD